MAIPNTATITSSGQRCERGRARRAGSRNSMSMRLETVKPVTTRKPIAPQGSGSSGRSATENPQSVAPTASQNNT